MGVDPQTLGVPQEVRNAVRFAVSDDQYRKMEPSNGDLSWLYLNNHLGVSERESIETGGEVSVGSIYGQPDGSLKVAIHHHD